MRPKRLTVLTGFLLFFWVLSSCAAENKVGWALYLRPDAIPAIELELSELESWPLRQKPFLTASDLVYYEWASHEIKLTQEAYSRVEGLFNLPIEAGGKDRIYAGAFWSSASSFFYEGVVINQPFDEESKTIEISFNGANPEEDPRSDPDIWRALFQKDLLGQSEEVVAFLNVNLVPMTSEIVVEDQTVLIDQGEIIAIGDSEKLLIPEGAQVIDGEGTFLMPGLVDLHMHTRQDWDDESIWPVHPLYLYQGYGSPG